MKHAKGTKKEWTERLDRSRIIGGCFSYAGRYKIRISGERSRLKKMWGAISINDSR